MSKTIATKHEPLTTIKVEYPHTNIADAIVAEGKASKEQALAEQSTPGAAATEGKFGLDSLFDTKADLASMMDVTGAAEEDGTGQDSSDPFGIDLGSTDKSISVDDAIGMFTDDGSGGADKGFDIGSLLPGYMTEAEMDAARRAQVGMGGAEGGTSGGGGDGSSDGTGGGSSGGGSGQSLSEMKAWHDAQRSMIADDGGGKCYPDSANGFVYGTEPNGDGKNIEYYPNDTVIVRDATGSEVPLDTGTSNSDEPVDDDPDDDQSTGEPASSGNTSGSGSTGGTSGSGSTGGTSGSGSTGGSSGSSGSGSGEGSEGDTTDNTPAPGCTPGTVVACGGDEETMTSRREDAHARSLRGSPHSQRRSQR